MSSPSEAGHRMLAHMGFQATDRLRYFCSFVLLTTLFPADIIYLLPE